MNIVLFHPTLLPPRDYGGVERVVLWLAKGLVEAGHGVWVAAYKGSMLPPGAKLLEMEPTDPTPRALFRILPPSVDLIHFMAPPSIEEWDSSPVANLLTVHGNGKAGEVFPMNTVFLSRDHAQRHEARVFVYNGIDPEEYYFRPEEKTDRYLFLSKTSWRVKNVRGAIQMCARAQVPLQVAGGSRPLLSRLEVLLRSQMQWIGPVAKEKKALCLTQAKALIFPVQWPEPFGLVIAEALMSGTPVIASAVGSIPELVQTGVGVALPLAEDEVWIELLKRETLPWSPDACRSYALKEFHYRVMTDRYIELYKKVAAGEKLHLKNPKAREWRIA